MKTHSLITSLLVLSLAAASACGSNTTTGPIGGGTLTCRGQYGACATAVGVTENGTCSVEPGGSQSKSTDEAKVCNGADDDCNGMIDDWCPFTQSNTNHIFLQLDSFASPHIVTWEARTFNGPAVQITGGSLRCVQNGKQKASVDVALSAPLPASSGKVTFTAAPGIYKCQIVGTSAAGVEFSHIIGPTNLGQ